MLSLLGLVLGIVKMVMGTSAAHGERGISLRKARKLARKMADMLEESEEAGGVRREEIVAALVAQGVAEPVARIVTEEAARRFTGK